jgi:hypothetical protein
VQLYQINAKVKRNFSPLRQHGEGHILFHFGRNPCQWSLLREGRVSVAGNSLSTSARRVRWRQGGGKVVARW